MRGGKLGQVTNFTIVGGTAKHCVDQYLFLFRYCALWATLLCQAGYTLGFAAHFKLLVFSSEMLVGISAVVLVVVYCRFGIHITRRRVIA